MLVDFAQLHKTYLQAQNVSGEWVYTATNPDNPRSGMYACSQQLFSNNSLLVAVNIYNSTNTKGAVTGVSHALYLKFARKVDGTYLVNADTKALVLHLKLGEAGALYDLATGRSESFSYRIVRTGKPPKVLNGSCVYGANGRAVRLTMTGAVEGEGVSISMELDRTAQVVLAAHCLAYAKLLYPVFSDEALRDLISKPAHCADFAERETKPEQLPAPNGLQPKGDDGDAEQLTKLRKVIWAIGNQKWPNKHLETLKAIQGNNSVSILRSYIDQANDGDFSLWDECKSRVTTLSDMQHV